MTFGENYMQLTEFIKDLEQLASLPEIVVRANELLNSPTAGVKEIGEVLSHDPVLAARILKLVNSAFYNFPSQIDTISRAITMIGTIELRNMILASTVTKSFNKVPSDLIDMDSFWRHSVFCGLTAKKLSEFCQTGKAETLFLTGLLHDIGSLILLLYLPEQARKILERVKKSKQSLSEIECQVLGFSTAELGSALLQDWQLPKNLWHPIRFQYSPEAAQDYADEARVLSLALMITDIVAPGTKTDHSSNFDTLAGTRLKGQDLSIEYLKMLAEVIDLECSEVLAIILSD